MSYSNIDLSVPAAQPVDVLEQGLTAVLGRVRDQVPAELVATVFVGVLLECVGDWAERAPESRSLAAALGEVAY